MNKRLLSAMLLLVVLLCAAVCACAGETEEKVLVIPANTTLIETMAFYNTTSLDAVLLPEGIQIIEPLAFAESSLTAINLPASLTDIADDAFDGCEGLTVTVMAGTAGETFVKTQGLEYRYDVVASPAQDFRYEIVDGEVTITWYLGDGGDVVVPDKIDGAKVTAIGKGSFAHTYSITSIVLPEGITSIPDNAFSQSSLISISIPDSVTSIGTSAFQSCPLLSSITIPDYVTNINYNAFRNCTSLVEVTLPASLIGTGEYSFADCKNLRTVNFANGITTIDDGSFYNCTNLTEITLPKNLATIGNSAFSGCANLTEITFPKSLTTIGYGAFSGCASLKQIVFPAGLTEVNHWSFENCCSLTKIEFSSTITNIMDGAFTNCDSLSTLSIPGNVVSIANDAFQDCDGITSVTMADGLSSIGSFAFSDCDKLKNIELPSTLTWVGSSAFSNCKSLNSIVLPDSIDSLGNYAFSDCPNLTDVTLPKNLKVIEDGVFQNCVKLTNITLPQACWKIKNYAFDGCSALSSVSFPDGVNTFGAYAFADCTSLTGISIRKWSSIGEGAFSGCSSLSVIHLDKPDTLANYAFANCTNLQKAYIHYLWGTLQPEIFANCPNLTIYGESGSYAETYANENDIPFVSSGTPPTISLTLESLKQHNTMSVYATASATDGINPYQYKFCLYDGDTLLRETEYDDSNECAFILREFGNYTVEAIVKDFCTATASTASTVNYGNEGHATISGRIESANGAPLQSAVVYAISDADEEVYQTTTGADGRWSITCPLNQTYQLQYQMYGYAIAGDVAEVDLVADCDVGLALATIANNNTSASFVTFQMSTNQVATGVPVQFTITAENAHSVQLVADGVAYEIYPINGAVCTIERAFTKAGIRSIQFLPIGTSGVGRLSEAQTLTVDASGKLEIPNIASSWAATAGVDLSVSWEEVPNADGYTVYLYHENSLIWKGTTETCSIVIPGAQFYEDGSFYLDLIATGPNYDQSSCGADISVAMPIKTHTVTGLFADEDNEPIAGVKVTYAVRYANGYAYVGSTESKANGKWTLNDLIPGCNYQIYWTKEGYEFDTEWTSYTVSGTSSKLRNIYGTSLGDGPLYLSEQGVAHWNTANVQTVTVHAPQDWSVSSNSDWFTATASGNQLSISMTDNTTGELRTGAVTITSGEYQVTLEVVQEAGDTFALSSRAVSGNKLSKKQAADLLNYIGGKGSCKWYLFVGYRPHESLQDYWKLLIGDTKKWTTEKIEEVSNDFFDWAYVRLTVYAAFVSADEMQIRSKQLVQYAADETSIEGILGDGAQDLFEELTDASIPDWMDAEAVAVALNSATSLKKIGYASEAKYILNELDKKAAKNWWESWIADADTMSNTNFFTKSIKVLDSYVEIIDSYR